MTKAFRVLAFLIAGLVFVQAFTMTWAIAGLYGYVDDGNSFTSDLMEEGAETPFPEVLGFMIHGMNGTMLIPLIALVTLVVGLLAKFPGSTKYGAAIFLLVVLQVALGLFGHEAAIFGGLHGINALLLFGAAVMGGIRAKDVPVVGSVDERPTVNA